MKQKQFKITYSTTSSTANIIDIVFAAVFTAVASSAILTMFGLCSLLSVITAIVVPVAVYIITFNKIFGRYIGFYVTILAALYLIIFQDAAWNGILACINAVIDVINQDVFKYVPFNTNGASVQFATIPLVIIIGTICADGIRFKRCMPAFLITFIPVVAGLFTGAEPKLMLFLPLTLCWILLFAMSGIGRQGGVSPIGTSSNIRVYAMFAAATVIITAVFSVFNYTHWDQTDKAANAITEYVEKLRYENTSAVITEYPNGDVASAGPLEFTENIVFTVDMEYPAIMYLRGFTGTDYKDGVWSAAEPGDDNIGLIQWLETGGMHARCQMSLLYSMWEDSQAGVVKIKNLAESSKTLYLPYEAIVSEDIENADYADTYIHAKGLTGAREYTFNMYYPIDDDYAQTNFDNWLYDIRQNTNYAEYMKLENTYRQYVLKRYVQASDEAQIALKNTGIADYKGKNWQSVVDYIRTYFSKNFTLDLEAQPMGEDALSEFMSTKSGYDVHFATAAVEMLRMAGVPARYAEGYYLSYDFMNMYVELYDMSFEITDSLAHAWVEVYVPEVGWLPIEVCPGYFTPNEISVDQPIRDDKTENMNDDNIYHDDQPIDPEDDELPEEEVKDYTVLIVILIILLIIGLFMLITKLRVRALMKSIHSENSRSAVISSFALAAKALKLEGVDILSSPLEVPNEVTGEFEGWNDLVDSVYKARFANSVVSSEEKEAAADCAVNIVDKVYARSSAIRKLIIKFVYCMK